MNRIANNRRSLSDIKQANSGWFSRGNKRFFGDVSYMAYYGKKTGKLYLVRSTYAWTDMFGSPKTLHYRINNINQDTLDIENLIDDKFDCLADVKAWIREN